MKFDARLLWAALKDTVAEIGDDDVPSLAAAIAYSTVFALPPLLVTIVAIAGALAGPEAVQEAITGEVGGLAGAAAAQAIQGMIQNASDIGESIGTKVAGLLVLLVGASGAFGQLQKSLNRAWDVKMERGGIRKLLVKRVLSFGMVVTVAFLLLVSLAVTATLAALSDRIGGALPGGDSTVVWQAVNFAVSFGVVTLLFAAMFAVLPDAKVPWRYVWMGAVFTALLFTIGKWAIGLYIGKSDPGSAFGAAGSLALILIWIYYSSLIVLAGAEFTQVWARHHGARVVPEEGAVVVDRDDEDVHPLAKPRDPEPY
jgi:membrane protein